MPVPRQCRGFPVGRTVSRGARCPGPAPATAVSCPAASVRRVIIALLGIIGVFVPIIVSTTAFQ